MGNFTTMLDLSEESVLVLFRFSVFQFSVSSFLPTNYVFSLSVRYTVSSRRQGLELIAVHILRSSGIYVDLETNVILCRHVLVSCILKVNNDLRRRFRKLCSSHLSACSGF